MNDWIPLLGKSTADAAVRAALVAAKIKEVKLEDDELNVARNVDAGLSITFTDETIVKPDDDKATVGVPVVTAVVAVIQNKRKPENQYVGALAYDVSATDGQKALSKRFGKAVGSNKELRTELFSVDALEVRVQYTDDFGALKRFSVSLPDVE